MFNFSFDKRTLYLTMGILAFLTIYQYATVEGKLLSLALSIPGVIIAIVFHEFAHAFVADKLGDHTAKMEGRLTLDPRAHLDPIGSLLLLLVGFGWGKPVHVDSRNYTRKMSVEKAQALVSIAGPIMNFLLAIVFTIITCITLKATNSSIFFIENKMFLFASSTTTDVILKVLIFAVSTNIGLGLFNLIPLPPLDGSKVLMPFLPFNIKQFFIRNEMIFYFVFIIIAVTPIASMLISPAIEFISGNIFKLGLTIFGL